MINVYQYLNYRDFLKDFFLQKKKENSTYSYRVFNKTAGIKSPSFLQLIFSGKRNLTEKTIVKCVKAVGLDTRAAMFFRSLVLFNQCQDAAKKIKYFDQLLLFKEFDKIHMIEKEQYLFYKEWHHVAILELTRLTHFREDPNWIAKKLFPQVTPEQAKESLVLLKSLGFLKLDHKKRLRPSAANFSTQREVSDMMVLKFHDKMIEKAQESLFNADKSLRDVSSVTIALDETGYLQVKKKIQEFRRELNVFLSRVKKPDQVYQINFQLFQLTDVNWKKNQSRSS